MPHCTFADPEVDRGPKNPGKSQVIVTCIWVSIEISIWTPLEKVGPPPPPTGKCVKKTLDPSVNCKIS